VAERDPELYKWIVQFGHNHPHGPEDFELTMPRVGGAHKVAEPDPKQSFAHSHGGKHHHHGDGHGHDHDH
jgi:hypothetical protein